MREVEVDSSLVENTFTRPLAAKNNNEAEACMESSHEERLSVHSSAPNINEEAHGCIELSSESSSSTHSRTIGSVKSNISSFRENYWILLTKTAYLLHYVDKRERWQTKLLDIFLKNYKHQAIYNMMDLKRLDIPILWKLWKVYNVVNVNLESYQRLCFY